MAQILFVLRTNNHFADEIHYIWLDLSVSDIFLFPANLYILLYQFFISISKRKDFDFNVLGVHHEINNVCVFNEHTDSMNVPAATALQH